MMKNCGVFHVVLGSLLATQAWAGTLSLNGSLDVSTNLNAQSITLGGLTQSNWPSTSIAGAIDLTNTIVDFSETGLLYRITLTNNASWVFTNHVAGRLLFLQITENGIGGWTNAWPAAGLLWPNGTIPTGVDASSNALSVYQILDNGTSWLVQAEGLNYLTNAYEYALQFDGNQNYVAVPHFSTSTPTTRTVEWWARSNGTGNGFYLGSWQDSVSQYNFLCINNAAANQWYVQTSTGTVTLSSVPTEASDGAWHHYALVESNTTVTVFIDGTSRGSNTASLGMAGAADFEIGNVNTGGSGPAYNGTIDEVRISSMARYTTTFAPVFPFTLDSDTVALWHCNEGSGSSVHDATGSNNGTRMGSPPPSWVPGR
jgi:Concanavalin A-like lectin/glucanases superfamily